MPSGDVVQMDSTQRIVFDAARPAVWSSKYNRDGVPDKDRFNNVLHAVEQSMWNDCTQSQLTLLPSC
ncbi:UNVERIFIED_CONTAM: hypothetical protein Sindi_0066100 [Sesamum indicum]